MGYKRVNRYDLVIPSEVCKSYRQMDEVYNKIFDNAWKINRFFIKTLTRFRLVYVLYDGYDVVANDDGVLSLYISPYDAKAAAESIVGDKTIEVLDILDYELANFMAAAQYYGAINSFEIKFPNGVKSDLIGKVHHLYDALDLTEPELNKISPLTHMYDIPDYVSEFDYKHGYDEGYDDSLRVVVQEYDPEEAFLLDDDNEGLPF